MSEKPNDATSFRDAVTRTVIAPVEPQPKTLPGFFRQELESRCAMYHAQVAPGDLEDIVAQLQPLLDAEYEVYLQRKPPSDVQKQTLDKLQDAMRLAVGPEKVKLVFQFDQTPLTAEEEAMRRDLKLKPVEMPLATMVESAIATALSRYYEEQVEQGKENKQWRR